MEELRVEAERFVRSGNVRILLAEEGEALIFPIVGWMRSMKVHCVIFDRERDEWWVGHLEYEDDSYGSCSSYTPLIGIFNPHRVTVADLVLFPQWEESLTKTIEKVKKDIIQYHARHGEWHDGWRQKKEDFELRRECLRVIMSLEIKPEQ